MTGTNWPWSYDYTDHTDSGQAGTMAKTQGQKDSAQQERRGAQVHGGVRNSGSGNTTGHKNDVITDTRSIEFKITRNKSYSLKLQDLITAHKEALLSGRDALFGIDFITPGRTYRYIVMEEYEYFSLVNGTET
jgi:hypothetical protein